METGTQVIPEFLQLAQALWGREGDSPVRRLMEYVSLGILFLETIQAPSLSHCPVTPQGKRKKEEGPRGMGGASLPPWSGLRDFGLLAKGLSGEVEGLGSETTG